MDDPNYNKPYLWINLMFGGYFADEFGDSFGLTGNESSNIAIKEVVSEEQIYAYLHFVTFLTAYESFSQGVLQKEVFKG